MSAVDELSPEEQEAYELITSRGQLYQSDLWKALDADSRKGTTLARSLAEKGLINRQKTTSEGRVTYLLTPTANTSDTTADTPSSSSAAAETGQEPRETSGEDKSRGLSEREQRAVELIRERDGIYQSEFWKELDVTSRTGSRIATNLMEKGAIRREEAVYNGQRTYLLLPAKRELDFSLLMAGDEISPFVGKDDLDPIESEEFTQWILRLTEE